MNPGHAPRAFASCMKAHLEKVTVLKAKLKGEEGEEILSKRSTDSDPALDTSRMHGRPAKLLVPDCLSSPWRGQQISEHSRASTMPGGGHGSGSGSLFGPYRRLISFARTCRVPASANSNSKRMPNLVGKQKPTGVTCARGKTGSRREKKSSALHDMPR